MELRNIREQRNVIKKLSKLSANVWPFPDNLSILLMSIHKKNDHPNRMVACCYPIRYVYFVLFTASTQSVIISYFLSAIKSAVCLADERPFAVNGLPCLDVKHFFRSATRCHLGVISPSMLKFSSIRAIILLWVVCNGSVCSQRNNRIISSIVTSRLKTPISFICLVSSANCASDNFGQKSSGLCSKPDRDRWRSRRLSAAASASASRFCRSASSRLFLSVYVAMSSTADLTSAIFSITSVWRSADTSGPGPSVGAGYFTKRYSKVLSIHFCSFAETDP